MPPARKYSVLSLSWQGDEPLNSFVIGPEFVGLLEQESMDRRQIFDGIVEDRVGAFLVSADAN